MEKNAINGKKGQERRGSLTYMLPIMAYYPPYLATKLRLILFGKQFLVTNACINKSSSIIVCVFDSTTYNEAATSFHNLGTLYTTLCFKAETHLVFQCPGIWIAFSRTNIFIYTCN